MRVIVTIRHRFESTPDGAVWSMGQFPYVFWTRYLAVFNEVGVVARVRPVSEVSPGWLRADAQDVSFLPVPYYIGPRQYLARAIAVERALSSAVSEEDAVIFRLPSQLASRIQPRLRRIGRPYGVELVSDPYDAVGPNTPELPLQPFFRYWLTQRVRRQCAAASAVAYVTEHALQRRYPPSPAAFSTHYSTISLHASEFAPEPRRPDPASRSFTLISVCSLAHLTKGLDMLIAAVGDCVRRGLDLRLVHVGSGRHLPVFRAQVAKLGLGDRVRFCGQLPPGAPVREQLDRADLFVLASLADALPRAMIEAMSRGLPCIGSTVGGFPELLQPEDIVPPGSVDALARLIRQVATDPDRMFRMSARNLEKAREYTEEQLMGRRNEFYQQLHDRTKAWQALRH